MRKKITFTLLLAILTSQLMFGQHMTGAIIDACGATEGDNEMFFMRTGSLSLPVNTANIDIRYNSVAGVFGPPTTFTDSLSATGDPAFVAGLNAVLPPSCDFNFVNAPEGTIIPPNSFFIVVRSTIYFTPDFTPWCGYGHGNVYVVFSEDQSWLPSGNFSNSPSGKRYFRVSIGGVQKDYEYEGLWTTTPMNGNYVSWAQGAGAPSLYDNFPGCNPTNDLVLPSELGDFNGVYTDEVTNLNWHTLSENNANFFEIERSFDQENWETLDFVNCHGNSNSRKDYAYTDEAPVKGTNYYRLRQVDYDGRVIVSNMIAVNTLTDLSFETNLYPVPAQDHLSLTTGLPMNEFSVRAYDMLGATTVLSTREDNEYKITFDVSNLNSGIYFVELTHKTGKQTICKFVKQ